MTWKQFRTLAILTNTLIIGGLWLVGFVADELPTGQLLWRTLIISGLAIFVITSGLLLFSHIAIFIRAKWRGELPKISQRNKWLFFAFLASLTFCFLALTGVWLDPKNGIGGYFEHFAVFGFWIAVVTGLTLLVTSFQGILEFRSINSAID